MQFRKAREIMSAPVITVKKDIRLTEAIAMLLRWHISGMPVVDDGGAIIGILTEHDIMNFAFSGDARDTRVEEAMTRDVTTFAPETDFETIVNCFASKKIRRFPILDGGRVVGIVSRRDILREMQWIYSD